MSHICIVGVLPRSLLNFRGELIQEMIRLGHRVTAMASAATQEEIYSITRLGAEFMPFPVQRNGLNPLHDLLTCYYLNRAFRELKPDLLLAYTVKPVIWGGLALTGLKGVRFYPLITGLGFAFQGEGVLRRGLSKLVSWLYRSALARARVVMFQNRDNKQEFITRGIVRAKKCRIISGSGVNLSHFSYSEQASASASFLMIARLLGEKGLFEYVNAARKVKERYPQVVFQLLGETDPSPDGIPLSVIKSWNDSGYIEYLGKTTDVRPFIAACHVYVLPSYHEGMPRTVLEAMAMGRPILTTDVPGCRETVVNGENGYLVPKGDAAALAERMIWFIKHMDQCKRMGMASRKMAEERFDVRKINAEMLRTMELTPDKGTQ